MNMGIRNLVLACRRGVDLSALVPASALELERARRYTSVDGKEHESPEDAQAANDEYFEILKIRSELIY